MVSPLGNLVTIHDSSKNSIVILKEFGEQKYMITLTPNDWKDANKKYEGISFTGHSLGGGLASANALAAEGKAVTFNAAGLSDATKKNNNLNGNVANINAFIVKGEILDWEARTTPGLSRAEGKKIIMPSAYTNWNQINRVRNHMIGAVKISFQKFIEESKKKD